MRESETREGMVESLFQAFCAIEAPDLFEQFLSYAIDDAEHYDLHTVMIPAAKAMANETDDESPGAAAYRRLLQHCIEAAIIMLEKGMIRAQHLGLPQTGRQKKMLRTEADLRSLQEVERAHILQVLEAAGNNRSRAAQILGIGRNTLGRKLKSWGY